MKKPYFKISISILNLILIIYLEKPAKNLVLTYFYLLLDNHYIQVLQRQKQISNFNIIVFLMSCYLCLLFWTYLRCLENSDSSKQLSYSWLGVKEKFVYSLPFFFYLYTFLFFNVRFT